MSQCIKHIEEEEQLVTLSLKRLRNNNLSDSTLSKMCDVDSILNRYLERMNTVFTVAVISTFVQ